MKTYKFKGIYTQAGWVEPAYVVLGQDLKIQSISSEQPENTQAIETINGWAIPSFYNSHSHAFQYKMAGTAESSNNFWDWREKMYQLALSIQPEELEQIAIQLYSELLRLGYSHVVEFHYLHYNKNGKPYTNRAEMAERILRAAKFVGINLTLVPILFQCGDFNEPALPEQIRFVTKNLDDYWLLFKDIEKKLPDYPNTNLGIGIHSLRTVPPDICKQFFASAPSSMVKHLHIAEQPKEVLRTKQHLGTTPVNWFLDNFELDQSYNLVHATHCTDYELSKLAKSGANVILCPSTEANLADGVFSFAHYSQSKGCWAIGTDSHIGLSPQEELRWLDYLQRLQSANRNEVLLSNPTNNQDFLFRQVIQGGMQSVGNFSKEFFSKSEQFNCIVISAEHPHFADGSTEYILPRFIYACDRSAILQIIQNGRPLNPV